MKEILLRTENLSKSFSSGGILQHVLKNIDLELYDGDFTVIMGASGAGKSTLLYALSGMDVPTLVFGMGTVVFCVAYCMIACVLVYKLAPKTFRLRA